MYNVDIPADQFVSVERCRLTKWMHKLERKGQSKELRIYQCRISDSWHLTHVPFRYYDTKNTQQDRRGIRDQRKRRREKIRMW